MTAPVRLRKPMTAEHYAWARKNRYTDDEIAAQGYELPSTGERVLSKIGSLARGAVQGLTMGHGDEAVGALSFQRDEDAPVVGLQPDQSAPDRYRTARDASRAKDDAAQQANPGLFAIGEFAGGVTSGAALPFMRGATAANAGLLRATLQGAKGGAAAGAVYGAGKAKTVGDIPGEAAANAAFGGIAGAAAPSVMKALTATGRGASRALPEPVRAKLPTVLRDAPEPRVAPVARGLERAGVTPDELTARLSTPEATRAGLMLADEVPELAEAVGTLPGRGARQVADALTTRAQGRTARTNEAVDDALGTRGRSAKQTRDVLEAQRAMDAEPLYEAVRQLPDVADDRLDAIVNASPRLQRMYRQAQEEWTERAATQGIAGRQATGARATADGEHSMAVMERFKRKLDDAIKTAQKRGADSDVEQLSGVQHELLTVLDEVTEGGYARAREAYAGPSRSLDALKEGKKAHLTRDDDLREIVQAMGTQERETARVGVADMMRRNPRWVRKLTGDDPNVTVNRAKLREALADDDAYNTVIRAVEAEAKGGETFARVTKGSPTAPRLAAQADLNSQIGADAAEALASGGTAGLARSAARAISQRARAGMTEKTRNAVAERLLLRPGTPEYDEFLRAMARAGAEGRALIRSARAAGAATGAARR